jgi:DNA-binding NtrC family response regulator
MVQSNSATDILGATYNMVMSPNGPMREILIRAEALASKNCSVLIHGETGTGKDLLARVIHGGRGQFVVIDCTHLNPQLAESELFGHARGAYTGADSERSGLIDAADGGCAFFDEIGELPLELQPKLLRLLQDKTYRRVGSTRNLRSEFRVIAATNRDLKLEVANRRFREDLYYRLNVAKIRIPPLRERKDDIPFLASYFSARAGIRLTEEILKLLIKHDWPGNVRELENCVYRIAARSTGERIDLPSTLFSSSVRVQPSAVDTGIILSRNVNGLHYQSVVTSYEPVAAETRPPRRDKTAVANGPEEQWPQIPLTSLENLERLAILRTLSETRGDRSRAASILGIGRATLYRKLQALEKHLQFRNVKDDLGEPAAEKAAKTFH